MFEKMITVTANLEKKTVRPRFGLHLRKFYRPECNAYQIPSVNPYKPKPQKSH